MDFFSQDQPDHKWGLESANLDAQFSIPRAGTPPHGPNNPTPPTTHKPTTRHLLTAFFVTRAAAVAVTVAASLPFILSLRAVKTQNANAKLHCDCDCDCCWKCWSLEQRLRVCLLATVAVLIFITPGTSTCKCR